MVYRRRNRTNSGQAKNSGLDLRIHIDEFKDCGGGELAADLKVRSADHAHHTSDYGREAMDSAGQYRILTRNSILMGELVRF